MPSVSSFYGIVITMYFYDHEPPHFHARYAEHDAAIRIADASVLVGSLPARARKLVSEWADRARGHSPSARIPVSANTVTSCRPTGGWRRQERPQTRSILCARLER